MQGAEMYPVEIYVDLFITRRGLLSIHCFHTTSCKEHIGCIYYLIQI